MDEISEVIKFPTKVKIEINATVMEYPGAVDCGGKTTLGSFLEAELVHFIESELEGKVHSFLVDGCPVPPQEPADDYEDYNKDQ